MKEQSKSGWRLERRAALPNEGRQQYRYLSKSTRLLEASFGNIVRVAQESSGLAGCHPESFRLRRFRIRYGSKPVGEGALGR